MQHLLTFLSIFYLTAPLGIIIYDIHRRDGRYTFLPKGDWLLVMFLVSLFVGMVVVGEYPVN